MSECMRKSCKSTFYLYLCIRESIAPDMSLHSIRVLLIALDIIPVNVKVNNNSEPSRWWRICVRT